MKRLFITLFVLVGAVTFANAQIVRSAGVVRKTAHRVEKTRQTATYEQEIGRWTQSAGATLGIDFESTIVIGPRYNISRRLSPLFAVGGNAWLGYRETKDGDLHIEASLFASIFPLANLRPKSNIQPFLGFSNGFSMPDMFDTGDIIGHAYFLNYALGCDIYGPQFNSTLAVEFSYRLDESSYLALLYTIKF